MPHTTIRLLNDRVPANYRSDVSRLKTALGSTIQNDDTPFDIELIKKHIGDFQYGWVKSHTGTHFKGTLPTATPAPQVPAQPSAESSSVNEGTPFAGAPLFTSDSTSVASTVANTVASTASAVVQTVKDVVIGGKKVPPANPESLDTKSAACHLTVNRTTSDNGGRYDYDGALHVELTKFQQEQIRRFADTMPDGTAKEKFLKFANSGDLDINWTADVPSAP